MGFTFSPGEQLRYPDVSEIRAASVYFTSKDAVKRTKRLNINKKYTYNEDGDIVLGAMGSIKKFPKRHGGIQKAFENPVDEKSNADYDEDSQQQQSEETNKELSNDSEECNQMAIDVYVKSPVEFDDKFKEEEDEMKKMGLPLSFLGNPGAGDEKRIPAFKIKDTLGMSTSSTSVNKSKKQRKKKAKNISNQASDIPCMRWQKQLTEDETNMVDTEFETYWTSNGENLVRKSWDELYGEYVVKEGDEIDYDAHKSHDNLCDQFNQLDITEGPLSPSDFDNPFLALFPSGVSMREILISTGKISPEQEELLPEINCQTLLLS